MKISVRVENDAPDGVYVDVNFDESFDPFDAIIALIAINKAVLGCFSSEEMQLLAKSFLLKFFEAKVANDSAKIVS